jgi:hypothetical protein
MLRQQVRILQRIMMTTPRICAPVRMILARMMQKPDHVRITGQNFTFELAKDI